jgi:uncharacterized small protein (DUF1192 family)
MAVMGASSRRLAAADAPPSRTIKRAGNYAQMTRVDKVGALLLERYFGQRSEKSSRGRASMKSEEDEAPRRPAAFEIGQPLDLLSIAELDERIERLRQEIARLEAARAAKQAASAAAEVFFRK